MELREGGILGNGNITCKWPAAGTTWHTPGTEQRPVWLQHQQRRTGVGEDGAGRGQVVTAGKGPNKVGLGKEVWILL